MIELERTFLARETPDLSRCKYKEIVDVYIPKGLKHPTLRIRKNGEKYEITKKQPVAGDASEQTEETIHLTKEEFESLISVDGKKARKIRYYYDYKGKILEIDVFQDELKGLILVDAEFDSVEEKAAFEMPEFCIADVTHEEAIAGGMVCGKTFSEVLPFLKKYLSD
jgi:adenylate cyclase